MFQKINFLIVTFFYFSAVFGQDLELDLLKISEHISKCETFFIDVEVSVLSKKNGTKIHELRSKLYKTNKAQLNIIDEIENYSNNSYVVQIDHEEKSILILTKAQAKNSFLVDDVNLSDLKKIKKFLEKNETNQNKKEFEIELVSNINKVKTYKIHSSGEIKEMIIKLDMNKLSLLEISTEYSESSIYKGQFIRVDYLSFSKEAVFEKVLNQNNYFTVSNGNYILATKYKNYQLTTKI